MACAESVGSGLNVSVGLGVTVGGSGLGVNVGVHVGGRVLSGGRDARVGKAFGLGGRVGSGGGVTCGLQATNAKHNPAAISITAGLICNNLDAITEPTFRTT